MVHMPHRSVTRFFIPMIDVLTLLFSVYLLMPMANPRADTSADKIARDERMQELVAELARRGSVGDDVTAQMREEIDKLRKEKAETLRSRLEVRVLEIDRDTGRLYYRDPERVELRTADDARKLIDRDRRNLGLAHRELYYMILYPRDRASGFPTVEQRQRYDRWFSGVAVSFDIPGKER